MERATIWYIANIRLPTEKAHGLQVMKTCEAFSRAGQDVELIVPRRFNFIKNDPFGYYSVEPIFKVTKLFCLDFIVLVRLLKKAAFWLESLSFYLVVYFHLLRMRNYDYIYVRDWLLLLFLSKDNIIIYEAHNFPCRPSILFKMALKKATKLVVISRGLKEEFIKIGFSPERIIVAADGVDLDMFVVKEGQEECRGKLGLPLDKKIAMYTGHLYAWKGVFTALEAAKHLPEILFVFVGGTEEDLKSFKANIKNQTSNIQIIGHRPHAEIPYWLKSADILVLPNSATEKISSYYTSPLKLFEYMASGVPIVASDLPSLREILNEENSVLVKPDDPIVLARSVSLTLNSRVLASKITENALLIVKKYAWRRRADLILEHIKF